MRVRNKTEHTVHVKDHGGLPGGEEATVKDSDEVRDMIKQGTLSEVKTSSPPPADKDKEGDS